MTLQAAPTSALLASPQPIVGSRRAILRGAGVVTLSVTAAAMLAGCQSMAQGGGMATMDPASDVAILNAALGKEYEAINAYQLGAESGLLSPGVLPVAVLFQSHHKEHAAAIEATIVKLGGRPAAGPTKAQTATALNAASLRNQTDVLMLAQRLERGAVDAYVQLTPKFGNRDVIAASAKIAADEAMHWAILTSALGQPLPAKAFSFG